MVTCADRVAEFLPFWRNWSADGWTGIVPAVLSHTMSFSLMPDARSKIYMLSCAIIMAPPWTAQAALDAELVPSELRRFAWYVAHFQVGVWNGFGLQINTDDRESLYSAFGPPSEKNMVDMVSAMVALHYIPRPDLHLAVGQLSTRLFFDRMIYIVEIYTLSCAMTMAPPWTAQAALDADLVPVKLRRFAESVAHFQKGVWSFMWMKFNTNDIETLYAVFGPPSERDMMDMVSSMVTLHEKPKPDLRLAVSQLPTKRIFDQIIHMFAANAVNVFWPKEPYIVNTCTPANTHDEVNKLH